MRIRGCMTLLGLSIGVGFGAALGGVMYALTQEMVFVWLPAIGAGRVAMRGIPAGLEFF